MQLGLGKTEVCPSCDHEGKEDLLDPEPQFETQSDIGVVHKRISIVVEMRCIVMFVVHVSYYALLKALQEYIYMYAPMHMHD